MNLLPVDKALEILLDGIRPKGEELVSIEQAHQRVLSQDLKSKRTHPPFNASAMDGYAVRHADASQIGARLKVVGESAAGRRFHGNFNPGETVRIFTGAPVPDCADTILIQENTKIITEGVIEVTQGSEEGRHIRAKGHDFEEGEVLLQKFQQIDYSVLTLAASMNYANIPVFKKPLVSVLATGDELVHPGEEPGQDQIVASNTYGIMALSENAGAEVINLGIANDRLDETEALIDQALSNGSDVLVTSGGASVGDHDLVQQALINRGMKLQFWKIAMRPGKPLMFGTIGNMRVIGLPGNPASSLVTSILFLTPVVKQLAGRTPQAVIQTATTDVELKANDQRQDYLRAHITKSANGELKVTPYPRQDSSLVRIFAQANGLLIRPPFAPKAEIGTKCEVILFEDAVI